MYFFSFLSSGIIPVLTPSVRQKRSLSEKESHVFFDVRFSPPPPLRPCYLFSLQTNKPSSDLIKQHGLYTSSCYTVRTEEPHSGVQGFSTTDSSFWGGANGAFRCSSEIRAPLEIQGA